MIIKTFQVKSLDINKHSFFCFMVKTKGLKESNKRIINKNFQENILKYEESEILNNPEIIFSELNNVSLFENKKINYK